MIFGKEDTFAIEAQFIEVYGKWTYGHLRFIISNEKVGDFEDTVDLASSSRSGRLFLKASPKRTRTDLDSASPFEVYEHLYGRFLYSGRARVGPPITDWWDRDPYLLDDVGESSFRDQFAIVAVRRADGLDRLIVYSFREENVSETLLSSGFCDSVIDSYCSWAELLRATG